MKHINAVKKLFEVGEEEEAEKELDNLLFLGPSNIEALKIRAEIFQKKGKFEEEAKIWSRIYEIDEEDPEAIDYMQRMQLEEREKYFFTEVMKENGRRFFAYPKSLFQISFAGLIGCMTFLYISSSTKYDNENVEENLGFLISSFIIMVVVPWISILYLYFKSLKTVEVFEEGVEISTRVKTLRFGWSDLETVCVSHEKLTSRPDVRLIFVPKDSDSPVVEIDLNEDSSSLKAKKQLLIELESYYKNLSYAPKAELATRSNKTLFF